MSGLLRQKVQYCTTYKPAGLFLTGLDVAVTGELLEYHQQARHDQNKDTSGHHLQNKTLHEGVALIKSIHHVAAVWLTDVFLILFRQQQRSTAQMNKIYQTLMHTQ